MSSAQAGLPCWGGVPSAQAGAALFAVSSMLLIALGMNLGLDLGVVRERMACGGKGTMRARLAALLTAASFVICTWLLYTHAADCTAWKGATLSFAILAASALASAAIAGPSPKCVPKEGAPASRAAVLSAPHVA